MAEEALDWLRWFVNKCQTLPQGFMQEGQYNDGSTDIWTADEPCIIRDGLRTDGKTKIHSWRHDVPAPECNCNVMTAVQEMLFQSYDGILRAFPAVPQAWQQASFRLYAVGGFIVTAERWNSQTTYVQVESTRGGVCHLANPWPGERAAVLQDGRVVTIQSAAEVFNLETQAGKTILIRRASSAPQPAQKTTWPDPGCGPREAYGRRLGIGRYF
jgi:hypothetical protein